MEEDKDGNNLPLQDPHHAEDRGTLPLYPLHREVDHLTDCLLRTSMHPHPHHQEGLPQVARSSQQQVILGAGEQDRCLFLLLHPVVDILRQVPHIGVAVLAMVVGHRVPLLPREQVQHQA